MVRQGRSEWKAGYFKKLSKCLSDYEKLFVVGVDNVGSKQMQQIRIALRDCGEVVMGKNTLMRKVIRGHLIRDSRLEKLLPHVHENIGFVFTKGDLSDVRSKLEENRVEAPAKSGTVAPRDVILPPQNTGLGPEKTAFFQALNIQTKITRGTIEIINPVPLIFKNQKVGASEATLLSMLNIFPFTYGLVIRQVYENGSVYHPDVLDFTADMMIDLFMQGVNKVAAASLALNYTTVASVPHLIANAFKDMLAVSVASDYTFKESEKIKEYLEDPSKFAAAAPAPAAAAPAAAPKKEEKAAAPPPAEESEEDSDIGMGLFD